MNKFIESIWLPILLLLSMLCSFDVAALSNAITTCRTADCADIEVKVRIDAGVDAGRRGVFGLVAVASTTEDGKDRVAFWIVNGEMGRWVGLKLGDPLRPAGPLYTRLPKEREYVIFVGKKERLCDESGADFNIFAWHASIEEAKYQRLSKFMDRFEITGMQADNLLSAELFYEAYKNGHVNLVKTIECPSQPHP